MRDTLPLPAETLLDIFQLALVDHSWKCFDLSSKPQHNPLQTAIVLASVCTHWRIIMLQSTAIWSKLLDVSYLNNNNELFNLVFWRMFRSAAPIWLRFHDLTPQSIISGNEHLLVPPGENQMRFVDMTLARLHHRVSRLDLDIWNPHQLTPILGASLPGIWARATHIHLGTWTSRDPKDLAEYAMDDGYMDEDEMDDDEMDDDEMDDDNMVVDGVGEDVDANEDQDGDGDDNDTDEDGDEEEEAEDIDIERVYEMRYHTELAFRRFLRKAVQARWRATNLTSLRLNGISPSAYDLVHILMLTPLLESLDIRASTPWHARDGELLQQSFGAGTPLEMVDIPHLKQILVHGRANFAMMAMVLPRLKLSEAHACEITISGGLGDGVGPFLQDRTDFAAFGPALRAIFRRSLTLTNCFEGAGEVGFSVIKVPAMWYIAVGLKDRPQPFHLMVLADTLPGDEDPVFPNWLTDAIFSPILTEAAKHKVLIWDTIE